MYKWEYHNVTYFLLPFQVSKKRTTKKTYVTEQYNKQCFAEPYVAKTIEPGKRYKPYKGITINSLNH